MNDEETTLFFSVFLILC